MGLLVATRLWPTGVCEIGGFTPAGGDAVASTTRAPGDTATKQYPQHERADGSRTVAAFREGSQLEVHRDPPYGIGKGQRRIDSRRASQEEGCQRECVAGNR